MPPYLKDTIIANLEFHGVGQGLFYSGSIYDEMYPKNRFNFVYDCGTYYSKDASLLKNEIRFCFDKPFNEKGFINALFISHLDKDHISGLPYLFDNYEVESVFIPAFSPEELILISIENEVNANLELSSFYRDPIEYFSERNVQNVFCVQSSVDGNTEENENMDKQNERIFAETQYFSVSGYSYDESEKNGVKVHYCSDVHLIENHHDWMFKIYQNQSREELEEKHKEIKQMLDAEGIKIQDLNAKNVILNKLIIDIVRKSFQKKEDGINQSSLVVYHGPAHNQAVDLQYKKWCCYCYMSCEKCVSSPATLLTGDINLTDLADSGNELEKFLKELPNEIGFFQIPHHGSKGNTSLNLVKKLLPNCGEMFCSYGCGNQFHHPDAYMLDRLMEINNCNMHHIVEHRGYSYIIKLKRNELSNQ